MATSKLDLVKLMNIAWERRKESTAEEYEEKVKNLISHAFVEYENIYVSYCKDKNIKYNDDVFYLFQRLILWNCLADDEFLQGEYDAYCKYCSWAKINPLTVEDCKALVRRTSRDAIVADLSLITKLRDAVDPENYQAMVQGFCYMSLLGDKSFDENEYYLIRCFLKDGYDYCPSTWEQFKREW